MCVCTIHQNVKLMVNAFATLAGTDITYKDLMEKLVCSLSDKLCMLHRCPDCPGSDALQDYFENFLSSHEILSDDVIQYKQWITTDRTNLQDFSNTLEDFLEKLTEKVDKLATHHFIAKHQSFYLSELKGSIPQSEAIMILDFAENYSFLIQDAAQGFHWENSQATVHPFVAYYKDINNDLCHLSMCVISDHLQHSTSTVHRFQHEALSYLQQVCPNLAKIHYFSDGAASQYKNFKNFCNLVHHEEDFGLAAEWHFFATSHGKGPCDGVGGSIKRLAARKSLQLTGDQDPILTPQALYDFAVKSLPSVAFTFTTTEQHEAHKKELENRLHNAKTIPGESLIYKGKSSA